ncbi:MAG: glycosyltransferase family 4 protein [Terrimicrobiaceae bacterium]
MSADSLWQLGMHFHPSGGGADRYFDDLLKGLERNGESFTAAAFDGETVGTEDFLRISLGPSKAALWKRGLALRQFGARLQAAPPPKVLATHFSLYTFLLLPFLEGTRHVVHFHGPWADEAAAAGGSRPGVFLKRGIEQKVYSNAARFITLSRAFRLLLIEQFGIRPEKISVVPGCVDLERFHVQTNRDSIRQLLGWPLNRRIIFCVRRLVARMGIAELIEAFAKIASRLPDVDLHIGGRGGLEPELRALVSRLGLEQRVVFCGFIPEEDLPGYYAASDLSIVPSQKLEGFGLVVLEALACGVPVLVTPEGGLPEIVSGLKRNLVLEGRDSVSLARGLASALEVPDFLPSGGECRAFVEKNYSIADMARRVVNVYREAGSP